MGKVIFAPQAIDRLAEIVRYIARDNPDVALHLGLRLVDHAELLGEFPELGSPWRKRVGVRRLWCKPYFIYYRLQNDGKVVEIMEFWHSARQDPEFR